MTRKPTSRYKPYVVNSKDGVSLPHRESVDTGAIPAPAYVTNHKQRLGRTSGKATTIGRASSVCVSYKPDAQGRLHVRTLTNKGKPIPTASEREDARRNAQYDKDMRKLHRTQGYIGEHAGRGW